MMTRSTLASTAAAVAAMLCLATAAAPAHADTTTTTTTLTFDELAAGSALLSTQYAALGVTFSANAFSGSGSSTSGAPWGSNTDLTVVSAGGSDVGSLGTPSLVSGNVLRSYANYLSEDGDASFRIAFAAAVDSVSVTFAGVSTAADTRLFVYDGTTLLATVAGSGSAAQFALGYSAASITSVVVAPGSYADYVAVDNIAFSPVAAVSEAGTGAMLALGAGLQVGLLAWRRRRQRGGSGSGSSD